MILNRYAVHLSRPISGRFSVDQDQSPSPTGFRRRISRGNSISLQRSCQWITGARTAESPAVRNPAYLIGNQSVRGRKGALAEITNILPGVPRRNSCHVVLMASRHRRPGTSRGIVEDNVCKIDPYTVKECYCGHRQKMRWLSVGPEDGGRLADHRQRDRAGGKRPWETTTRDRFQGGMNNEE